MVTIRDVAAAAGVAPSVVSYVITGKKQFPPETVARVRASAAALGYRPDPAARALALGKTNIIGLLASVTPDQPDADADIFMRFVRAAVFSARKHGYDILVMGRGDDELQTVPLVDALLVMDVRLNDPRLPQIQSMGKPTVLIGNPRDAFGMSYLDLDFAASAALAVDHLADLGHAQVAVLGSSGEDHELSWIARFADGAVAASARRAVEVAFEDMEDEDDITTWLATGPQATGVILHNVSLLDAFLRALADRGTRIPQDMSVIVLAPVERMSPFYPRLTTLDLPGRRMVEGAVELLIDEMASRRPGQARLVAPTLVEAGSTAPPPA